MANNFQRPIRIRRRDQGLSPRTHQRRNTEPLLIKICCRKEVTQINPRTNTTMKTKLAVLSLALTFPALSAWAQKDGASPKLDRTVLPIPEPNYPLSTVLDAREATA